MATVKNILSQIFFPKRQELSSHEPYSGSCGTRAQWNLNPENEELRITGTGPLFDFFGEKEVPWESHLDHIRKVVVAHGITYIGFQAFSYCTSLSSVELPDTLTGIGQHAFADCKNLTEIKLPEGLLQLKSNSFAGCISLASVSLPPTVAYLGNSAFEGCNSFTRIDIPDKIVHIGDRVFADCHALEQITIPPSVHHLGKHIFSGCRSLKTLTVPFPACGTPATYSNFGELFGTTPDTEMRKISQDNETGKETNYYLPRNLSVLRILEGCEVIPSKCLMNCFVLKELHLPASLYMMGEKAIYGCAGLKNIYCQAAEPASIHADTFESIRFNVCRLHVPQGSTEKYKQDKHWKPFSLIEE
ncbi:leucine-rich repeat domain-containing protein [Paraprevotella xylaniphila]|nr:leucine-rich repeat domain-containing protein [Paraprevotella xylaniphila]